MVDYAPVADAEGSNASAPLQPFSSKLDCSDTESTALYADVDIGKHQLDANRVNSAAVPIMVVTATAE